MFKYKYIIFYICFFISSNAQASNKFIEALNKKNWKYAYEVNDPDFKTLTLWLKFVNYTNPDFYDLVDFIKKNPSWPKIDLLKRKIEENSFSNCRKGDILQWFKNNPPKTVTGRKKYLSLIEDKQLKNHYIKLIWEGTYFSEFQEKDFLKKYGNRLSKEDYLQKINFLLFNDQINQAERILPFISPELRHLYKLRISLHKGNPKALDEYNKLSYKQKQDIGLLYNLAHMYEKNKDEKNLIETLNIASKLGGSYQFCFWNMKAKLIRNLVKEKDYKTAYLFASSHGHLSAKEYSEAEWLAGWIALRFLDQPKIAIKHFNNLYNKVKLPISLARGSYWLGRSYEQMKDKINSDHWYKIASKYYISFYGQLAICKIDNCNLTLPQDTNADHKSHKLFNNNPLVKSALILEKTRYEDLVQEFLFKAIENSDDYGEMLLITKVGLQIERAHISVETAKQLSYKDIYVIDSNYPVLKFIFKDHQVDQALIMSLIRQESVFNHKAISSAGAMGLMQIMPHVAKKTAKNIKELYHKNKLINDPHFNTKLGITHLEELLKTYNDSYVLSIAAYNAGGKAVNQWIENNGDPRSFKNYEDVVDWMEKITFHETRNYVQRVLEGKNIYNILLNKKNKLFILKDLQH